jgi:hypothetical protein
VDGEFGQWTLTLGWMATLGWTATSGWPETGWPATLGSEGWWQGNSQTNETELLGWESFFFFFKNIMRVFKMTEIENLVVQIERFRSSGVIYQIA